MRKLVAAAMTALACAVFLTGAAGPSDAAKPPAVSQTAPHDYPDQRLDPTYPVAELVAEAWWEHPTAADILQCGKYAAWRVDQERGLPTWTTLATLGYQDATDMDDTARTVGLRVDQTPAVGSIGIIEAGERGTGPTGHAFFVSRIFTDGSLLIEQMNWEPGRYSQAVVPADWADSYVHFVR